MAFLPKAPKCAVTVFASSTSHFRSTLAPLSAPGPHRATHDSQLSAPASSLGGELQLDAPLGRSGQRLRARARAKLPEDRLDMELHRMQRDVESPRDRFVG